MSNDTNLTIVGFLTSEPELKNTSSGLSVVNITIASTPSKFDKNSNSWVDGQTLFMRATAWRSMAEQIASSMHKGNKVIALGKLIAETYKDKDGNDRTSTRLDLESIGIDLSHVPKSSYASVDKVHVSDNVYEFVDRVDEDSPF